ncbi:methyltransferase domain-containing protein [Candidatus Woesearchaeota archaeon]|nr:methyltransferase domain-containing protein [Candidatus Woesearchaeota archaeon]
MSSYIDMMAKLGVSYLHQGGLISTKKLLKNMHIKNSHHVLDVGCGTGATAHYLNKKFGCNVIGIDISKDMIKKARKNENDKVKFLIGDATNLDFEDKKFDIILCESVLAYINKNKALKEFRRVLKNKGFFGSIEWTWLKESNEVIQEKTKIVLDLPVKILKKNEWESLYSLYFSNLKSEVFQYGMGNKYILKKLFSQGIDFFKIVYGGTTNPDIKESVSKVKRHFESYGDYIGYGIYICKK